MHKYELISGSENAMDSFLEEISNAKKSVYSKFSTFELDEIGKKYYGTLIEAAKSDIDIKFQVDHYIDIAMSDKFLFIPRNPITYYKLLGEHLRTSKALQKLSRYGEVKVTNLFEPTSVRNFICRDHRKILIVDSKTAFLGGLNISDHNYSWHDCVVKIKDKELVTELKRLFLLKFKDRDGYRKKKFSNFSIYQRNDLITKKLLTLIKKAKSQVFIESPYITNPEIYSEVNKKLKEGVEAKIIIPKQNNRQHKKLAHYLLAKKYSRIVRRRLKPQRMVHSKLALIDDTTIFGSSNFDSTYDLELSVFLRDANLAKQFNTYFKESISNGDVE